MFNIFFRNPKSRCVVWCIGEQDMQATTPMDPRALDAMMEYQLERYGNPHSRTHAYGWESEAVVERAREQVANLIGASPKEVRTALLRAFVPVNALR